MKPTISSHSDNDRWSLYEFTRDSKLPMGYFDQGISPDTVVVILSIAIALAVLVGVVWTEGGL
jgi:hypothetical protein